MAGSSDTLSHVHDELGAHTEFDVTQPVRFNGIEYEFTGGVLGSGSFGRVLLGRRSDQEEGRDVAIKIVQAGDEQHSRRSLEVATEARALEKLSWRFVIIDEAHRIKNEASLFARTARSLRAERRLLVTGTPLQNNLHELWALLNFLLPDVFASSDQFDEWFDLDVEDEDAKKTMITQLHKLLRPFVLRRLKVDVEKSLPPKTETILFTGLSVSQKQVYKSLLKRDASLLSLIHI